MKAKRCLLAIRKGFTLVELVLAIAITAILVTNVGYLIQSAVRIRTLAYTREELLQTSMRLHTALVGELETSAYATVYKEFLGTPQKERVIYLKNGELWVNYTETDPSTHVTSQRSERFLPHQEDGDGNVVGFDFYNGAVLADEMDGNTLVHPAFSIKIVTVQDYNIVDNVADLYKTDSHGNLIVPTFYRCIQITTTLQKRDRYYTHTSTIRFNELALYADEASDYSGELYVAETLISRHTATGTDASQTYKAISYTNKS